MSARTTGIGGFTLLEMLAATAMVALLAGSLYASLHVAFKAKRSAEAAVETARRGSMSLEFLASDLQSAAVPNGILAQEFVGRSAQGAWGTGSDTLTFCAAAMDVAPDTGIGDIKKIEYSCQDSQESGRKVLVRRITTNLLAPVAVEGKAEVICRGVRTFSLRFFDGTTWLEEWDSTTQNNILPLAVEVTIELAEGSDDNVQRLSRVVSIPCGQPANTADSAGGSS